MHTALQGHEVLRELSAVGQMVLSQESRNTVKRLDRFELLIII